MRLSSHYRCVRAIFKEPTGVKFRVALPHVRSHFRVGLAEYRIAFTLKNESESVYYLSFYLIDIHGSPAELAAYFSRLLKRQVGPEEADQIKYNMKVDNTKVLGLGNAGQVFGSVLAVIRQFVDKYRPRKVYFIADGDSRISLYKAMIKRYLPESQVTIGQNYDRAVFHIYFPGE